MESHAEFCDFAFYSGPNKQPPCGLVVKMLFLMPDHWNIG